MRKKVLKCIEKLKRNIYIQIFTSLFAGVVVTAASERSLYRAFATRFISGVNSRPPSQYFL